MNRQMLTTIPLAVILSIGLSCGSSPRDGSREVTDVEGAAKVLIATRPSAFKKEILNKLIDNYNHKTQLTIVDIDELDGIQDADYDALVVMGARRGWLLFSAKERQFLDRLETPSKLVVLMTAAISNWKWDRKDIDVITCASKQENVAPIYSEISNRLDAILEK